MNTTMRIPGVVNRRFAGTSGTQLGVLRVRARLQPGAMGSVVAALAAEVLAASGTCLVVLCLLAPLGYAQQHAQQQQPSQPEQQPPPQHQQSNPHDPSTALLASPSKSPSNWLQNGQSDSGQLKSKGFSTPQDAAEALCAAARKNDSTDLLVILGPDAKDLIDGSTDKDGQDDRQTFVHKYEQMHRLVREPDDTVQLYVGAENWPLPIPIVQSSGQWHFDTSLGKTEILYRQVGRNETDALEVSRALIESEKEYYAGNHSYTNQFISSQGAQDGLYWQSATNANRSPIGHYLAQAGVLDSTQGKTPFHGYFYRILLQDHSQPDNDSANPVTGSTPNRFIVLAFPAQYRVSGVMTFLVDENGDAYEKDLGPTSDSSAIQIKSFDPDRSWQKVE